MREDDGRKLDHRTLEALRIRAVRRVRAGEHPAVVAQAIGMTRAAVYAWLAQARQGADSTGFGHLIPPGFGHPIPPRIGHPVPRVLATL